MGTGFIMGRATAPKTVAVETTTTIDQPSNPSVIEIPVVETKPAYTSPTDGETYNDIYDANKVRILGQAEREARENEIAAIKESERQQEEEFYNNIQNMSDSITAKEAEEQKKYMDDFNKGIVQEGDDFVERVK